MASRIITKKGSGAPLASDLVHGELAVDTVNKRLYTENASGTVLELGTSPSTIDINAGTIDGTVIGGSSAAAGTFTTFTSTGIDDNATSTAITIDASENVGIGTTSPVYPLQVNGQAYAVQSVNANGSAAAPSYAFGNDEDCGMYRATTNTLGFSTNGSEHMRINSVGNVGIGVSTISKKFEVVDDSSQKTTLDMTYQISVGMSSTSVVGAGEGGGIGFIAPFNGSASTVVAAISGERENATSADGQGILRFGVRRSNLSANMEAMRIDSSGNLLIGTTTGSSRLKILGAVNSSASEVQVGTNGYAAINFLNASGSQQGYIVTNASSVSLVSVSDQRLKENITDANDAGDKIDAIQVRQYDWKADGSHQDYGMIAQELMTVAPEAVSGDPESNEMMGVDYSKLVPMLVKEIQSLRARVAQLEN